MMFVDPASYAESKYYYVAPILTLPIDSQSFFQNITLHYSVYFSNPQVFPQFIYLGKL